MESITRSRLGPQLVFGLFAISLGILFTLDNLGIVDFGDVWRFWPAILIAFGVCQILCATCSSRIVAGAVFIAVGALLLLDNLHYLRFSIGDFWPLILVVIGGSLVWQALERGNARWPASSDDVSGFAFMSGVVRNSNTQSFRGGDLTAIMGGCEIDLRQASISDGEATMQVLAFWGGIEIKVPEDWSVQSSVVPLLGGFEDRTRPPRDGTPKTLHVKGLVMMGGVDVHN